MIKAVQWLLFLYLALKACQFLYARKTSFQTSERSIRQRLLAGEPLIFIIALAVAVPAALGTNWWNHRLHSRIFQYSTDCYGRLKALSNLPDVEMRFEGFAVYERTHLLRGAAQGSAAQLGMKPVEVSRALSGQASAFIHQFSRDHKQGAPQIMQRHAAAVERCMTLMPSEA